MAAYIQQRVTDIKSLNEGTALDLRVYHNYSDMYIYNWPKSNGPIPQYALWDDQGNRTIIGDGTDDATKRLQTNNPIQWYDTEKNIMEIGRPELEMWEEMGLVDGTLSWRDIFETRLNREECAQVEKQLLEHE
jgi:hypothetical protein